MNLKTILLEIYNKEIFKLKILNNIDYFFVSLREYIIGYNHVIILLLKSIVETEFELSI